mgnify:CR=1 FL=1
MDLKDIDISKLPSDVRKELLQLQVMVAEKKIKNKVLSKLIKIKFS